MKLNTNADFQQMLSQECPGDILELNHMKTRYETAWLNETSDITDIVNTCVP